MQVIDPTQVQAQTVEGQGAVHVTMRVLIGCEQSAPTFVMRLFEVGRGGNTPLHSHDWEHEVFILEGDAEIVSPGGRVPVSTGMAAIVQAGEEHQFVNMGDGPLRFLCLVPLHAMPC